MAGGFRAGGSRRCALGVATGYLAVAWGCVLYAWLDPGRYSLAFLLPFLATAPASVLTALVVSALGLQGSPSPTIVAAVLAGCGLVQAAAVYALLGRGAAEPPYAPSDFRRT